MNRRCPVCGGAGRRSLLRMNYALFEDSRLPRSTSIDECSDCACVFADSQATEQDYVAHYQASSIYAAANLRAGSGEESGDRERLIAACARIAPHMGQGGLLIDVGAGSGGMLAQARERLRCDVLGIDPDPACVAGLAARGWDAAVGQLDIELAARYAGRAKVVALSHVLEHLWSPPDALRVALTMVADDGVVYVETPDRSRYAQCPNVPFYYFDPEHINHFSVGDFARLANECGGHLVHGGQSDIRLAGGAAYPVCWAVIAPGGASTEAAVSTTGSGIARYIAQQQAAVRDWSSRVLRQLDDTTGSWVIWGCGSQTQRVLSQDWIPLERVAAIADSDSAKQGRRFAGKPVLAPQQALDAHPDATVLVLAADSARGAILAELAEAWPRRRVLDLCAAPLVRGAVHA